MTLTTELLVATLIILLIADLVARWIAGRSPRADEYSAMLEANKHLGISRDEWRTKADKLQARIDKFQADWDELCKPKPPAPPDKPKGLDLGDVLETTHYNPIKDRPQNVCADPEPDRDAKGRFTPGNHARSSKHKARKVEC